jgi:hypothetical protein
LLFTAESAEDAEERINFTGLRIAFLLSQRAQRTRRWTSNPSWIFTAEGAENAEEKQNYLLYLATDQHKFSQMKKKVSEESKCSLFHQLVVDECGYGLVQRQPHFLAQE